MADPFQPRFVDLVRNYTTTTGTGNFILGPAVNGYTGFAAACQVGDSFYYSAIGVDKPAEREVGRGTLLAGGAISRDPINGTTTNFTAGTKSIALIAAGEWFTAAQATGGVATRTALAGMTQRRAAAFLAEAGREGHFLFDPSNLSAQVAADTAQGIYVAPASDPIGAGGAWVRKYSGPLNVRWFGAKGDKISDDYPAFAAAIAALGRKGGAIYVPDGTYRLSQRLVLTTGIHLIGERYGRNSGVVQGTTYAYPDYYLGSKLFFDAGVPGIILYSITDVSDPSTVLAELAANGANSTNYKFPSANFSTIEHIAILSAGGGTSATHGIETRTVLRMSDCVVRNFGGNGIEISASGDAAMGGGDDYGLADLSAFTKVYSIANRGDGFHAIGRDANIIQFLSCSGQSNSGCGFNDQGFLGNCYVNCHATANTLDGYRASNANASHSYVGCYLETGGTASLTGACTVIGGNLASSAAAFPPGELAFVMGGGLALRAGYKHRNSQGATAIGSQTGKADTSMAAFAWGQESNAAYSEWKLQYAPRNDQSWGVRYANNMGCVPIMWPDGTTRQGRSFACEFPQGICIGNQGGAQDRLIIMGTGAPATGTWTQGDLVLSRTPAAGATFAWRCTASGSPGTWEALNLITSGTLSLSGNLSAGTDSSNTHGFYGRIQSYDGVTIRGGSALQINSAGNAASCALAFDGVNLTIGKPLSVTGGISASGMVSSSGGVGYAVGLGGSVTQATSKSTGVTLNKLGGQIVMNAASLAAGAIAEFTVSDSQVAATDTINLNLASGAATSSAYRYWVSAVAAGSFKVVVENRSAGALAEALVLNFAVLKTANA